MSMTAVVTYGCLGCSNQSETPGYCATCKAKFQAENVARKRAKRRERIATAALTGLAYGEAPECIALKALAVADALIAALDK